MKPLIAILLLAVISLVSAESEIVESRFIGEDYKYSVWSDEAVGFKFEPREGGSDQFYYFCEKTKKKNCGSWVDEKGNKMKSANLKVTLKGGEAVFSKLQKKDTGRYYLIAEDLKKDLGVTRLIIQDPPPPPPPKY
ncbi:hypothetical protein GCK72_004291 [Caenorhabditis remanei]|uniref:Uncharacterized protein n=1 Tax=Caenorhabditis remanei TaxID=31234 RepID=A0A6A5HC02_CAERE|nr:hypothetical protein GCK72_004291 [Caenorhabditis remanei]KAF1764344.1 hypothetical protein GCK72_004291 [Caenorhabditis remanei]